MFHPSSAARWAGCVLLAGLACVPVAAQSTQWKWRDAQGHVQYSDRPPPPGIAERDILTRPAGARPTAAPMALPASVADKPAVKASAGGDPALEAKRRQADTAEKAKRDAEEEKLARQRQENCTRARDYQRVLADGQRISRLNERGEREILSDADRARESAKVQEVVSSDCR